MMHALVKNTSPLLNLAGTALDRSELEWMNAWVCRLQSKTVIPFLKRALPVHEIFLRRSALTPKDFNFVFSDLDLGVIADEKDFPQVIRGYQRVKKAFPFLGELEVYTPKEHSELTSLLATYQKSYSFFRDLRKIGWMEKKYLSARHEYEKSKFIRAIAKSLSRLGSSKSASGGNNLSDINTILENFFSDQFPLELREARKITDSLRMNITCPYFGRRFLLAPDSRGGPSDKDSTVLYLKSAHAFLLMALAPPMTREKGQLDATLAPLRQLPNVRTTLAALTRIELLIFRSVFRTFDAPNDLDLAWLKDLTESDAALTLK